MTTQLRLVITTTSTTIFSLVGSFPSGIVASHSFHCCITVSSCAWGQFALCIVVEIFLRPFFRILLLQGGLNPVKPSILVLSGADCSLLGRDFLHLCSSLFSLLDRFGLVFTVLTNYVLIPYLHPQACSSKMLVSTYILNSVYVFAGYERQDEHLQGQRA